jgi:hypothetical protein
MSVLARSTAALRLRLLAYLAIATPAVTAVGQGPGRCDFVFPNTPATRATIVRLPNDQRRTYLGGGVVAHCAGQNNRLVADSAEHHADRGILYLFGNVRYTEPRATVQSARMTYYQGEERLNAAGNVLMTFANGTTMRGPVADYYRVTSTRPKERLVATSRPQMTFIERDTAGVPRPPVIILADRVVVDGDSLVYASGSVDITRTDVRAVSDSAFLDGSREFARLIRSPRVVGRGQRPFTLEGGVIDLYSRNRQLERVVATPRGHATSGELELFADSIDLRIAGERLERAFAWGPSRARATSPQREIVADSLDVRLPGQRLDEVRAVGDAFATSIPDTAQVISNERDWLQGDTIVARFTASDGADAVSATQARELEAIGDARSFQQLASQNGARDQPNLNYVRGNRILVELRQGEVETVTVSGDASGVYLERARP